jgi:PKD repeat protein
VSICLLPHCPPVSASSTLPVFPRSAHWIGLALTGTLAACSAGEGLLLPSEGEPASIVVIRGDGQLGRVGEPLGNPLVVQVTDTRDRPVEGAAVTFELTAAGPGANVIPRSASTDANGEANAQIVLGTTVGQQRGMARVVMSAGTLAPEVSFTATVLSENANMMAPVAGEDQTGLVGSPLADRLVVKVTDAFDNPISGVPINWSAEGGGSVSEATVSTDAQGLASVERVLGPAAGPQTTIASSEGLAGSPITFVHTALAGNASRLALISGDDQTGQIGSALSAELVVRVIDGEGNGVPGTAVTWVVAIGGGSVTPANSITDEDGRASAQWVLGSTPGPNRLDAVVSGVGVVSFDATGAPGAPAALSIRVQPPSAARNGVPFDRAPVVQLLDAQGNEVSSGGIPITAALGSGGGSLTGTRQRVTDGNGRASFSDLAIMGPAGRYTLVFSSPGYASTTSAAVEVRSAPTTTTITADLPDPSAPGAPFTVQFKVSAQGVTPGGTVSITDGVESCSGSLSGGAGACQLSLSTPGNRTLRATYGGGTGLDGSSDTETHRVQAPQPENRPPTAAFTWSCEGLTCRFTDQSSDPDGSVVGRSWTFGDGSPLTADKDPTHTFPSAGNYTVTLTVTDDDGATDAGSSPVAVQAPPQNQAPVAGFTSDCKDLSCKFKSDGSRDPDGKIIAWAWSFGDGATSAEPDPKHDYAAGGTYSVSLTVTDDGGASTGVTHAVTVNAPPPPPNHPPRAEFAPSCTNLACSFTDQSRDDDGSVVAWSWTLGDGSTSNQQSPSHTYSSAGTYDVTLTVTDDDGAANLKSRRITVNAPPAPNQPPTADFTSSCSDLVCDFADGSADSDGEVSAWSWDFGDGSGSTARNPSHSYTSGGSYDVTLTITDDDGANASVTHQVTVTVPPPPNVAPSAQIGSVSCTGLSCSFGDGSTDPDGSIQTRVWDYGDNSAPDGLGSRTYASSGSYTVTLTVTDDDGAQDSDTEGVTISGAGI